MPKTKTVEKLNLEALFIDDCALITNKESDHQHIVNMFVEASSLFGLTVSLGKTEVMLQPTPTSTALPPSIAIEDTR